MYINEESAQAPFLSIITHRQSWSPHHDGFQTLNPQHKRSIGVTPIVAVGILSLGMLVNWFYKTFVCKLNLVKENQRAP